MELDVKESPLFKFVEQRSPTIYEELLKLRSHVQKWIANINTTFPHYPSHGLDHSDEIVRGMSAVLFESAKIEQAVVNDFNEIEASILIAAAYTHDLGMVVSDEEKRKATKSDDWKEFIGSSNEAKTLSSRISKLLDPSNLSGDAVKDSENTFLASVAQRHLFAEYFRKQHASRSVDVLHFDPTIFGADFLQDRKFRDAVAKVGESHGLRYIDLENSRRYPEDSIIQGHPVSLRFLAIILRLGDLLDMRVERSDNTFARLTSLPESSVPHWGQYEDFRDECVNHEKIAFTAHCATPQSYRVLRQWCGWMEEEVKLASELMRRAKRHADWIPPRVKIASAEGHITSGDTVVIKPAPSANFEPHDWKFYLNEVQVINRLTRDIYNDDSFVFIRELIQNSLDATRAKLVSRLDYDDLTVPTMLSDVDLNERKKLPIKITLKEHEGCQWVEVQDKGIGMDEEVIKRFFLQVGQSFYTTNEFESQYNFTPSSRFGIGFLSVFGVSNHVEVTTYKGHEKGRPLKLTLNSPADYILTERLNQDVGSGTTISLKLKNPIDFENLKEYISRAAGRAEFPIVIQETGGSMNVPLFNYCNQTVPAIIRGTMADGSHFNFTTYEIREEYTHGQLGVWFLHNENGETLNYSLRDLNDSIGVHIGEGAPHSEEFYHGIKIRLDNRHWFLGSDRSRKSVSWIDYRGGEVHTDLARQQAVLDKSFIDEKIRELVKSDLDKGFTDPYDIWSVINQCPEPSKVEGLKDQPIIVGYINREPKKFSLTELGDQPEIHVIFGQHSSADGFASKVAAEKDLLPNDSDDGKPYFLGTELNQMQSSFSGIATWLGEHTLVEIWSLNSHMLFDVFMARYTKSPDNFPAFLPVKRSRKMLVRDIPKFCLYKEQGVYDARNIVNTLHPCGEWIERIQRILNAKNDSRFSDKERNVITTLFHGSNMPGVAEILRVSKLDIWTKENKPPATLDDKWSKY